MGSAPCLRGCARLPALEPPRCRPARGGCGRERRALPTLPPTCPPRCPAPFCSPPAPQPCPRFSRPARGPSAYPPPKKNKINKTPPRACGGVLGFGGQRPPGPGSAPPNPPTCRTSPLRSPPPEDGATGGGRAGGRGRGQPPRVKVEARRHPGTPAPNSGLPFASSLPRRSRPGGGGGTEGGETCGVARKGGE